MSLQSSNLDSSLEDVKSKEERQTIFFTLLNPFGDNPDEQEPSDDLSKPRKVHYHSKLKILRTPSTGSARAEKSEGYILFAHPMWQPFCKIPAHSYFSKEFCLQEISIPL